jgi:hypothetical protein
MKKFNYFTAVLAVLVLFVLVVATVAFAGNAHRDGKGVVMSDVFTPVRGTSVTHTKADVTYTPTSGTKKVRFQPSAAVSYKINGTGTAYPVAANANEGPMGIGTRSGVGTAVSSIVFTGISSATKTIYIQEQ